MKRKQYKKLNIENIDIREVLDDISIHYTEEGKNVSSGWIGVSCPFCDDHSNHLGIHIANKTISCFKCGTTGTVIKYLSEELQSFSKAIKILGDNIPRQLRGYEEDQYVGSVNVDLPSNARREISPYHAEYLKRRNFNPEKLKDLYNLHFVGPIGKWRNRIIIPVVKNYKLITFTSIDISDDTNMRYKHLEDELSVIPIKKYLFGLDQTDGYSVIVVEGIFDQFRIGEGCVATFGTKVTSEQKKLLSKFSIVKIVFDGDDAGRIGANKLAEDLAPFCDVKIFDLPDKYDPDKLSERDIRKIKES